jgi:hypothetical protein
MWKSDLNVVTIRIVFHSGCGKCCGNLQLYVEKGRKGKVFHISTGHFWRQPVEMWKTFI